MYTKYNLKFNQGLCCGTSSCFCSRRVQLGQQSISIKCHCSSSAATVLLAVHSSHAKHTRVKVFASFFFTLFSGAPVHLITQPFLTGSSEVLILVQYSFESKSVPLCAMSLRTVCKRHLRLEFFCSRSSVASSVRLVLLLQ